MLKDENEVRARRALNQTQLIVTEKNTLLLFVVARKKTDPIGRKGMECFCKLSNNYFYFGYKKKGTNSKPTRNHFVHR